MLSFNLTHSSLLCDIQLALGSLLLNDDPSDIGARISLNERD